MTIDQTLGTLRVVELWLRQEAGQKALVCGEARGGREWIGRANIVISGPIPPALYNLGRMCKITGLEYAWLDKEDYYAHIVINDTQINLFVADEESWGASILYYTGNTAFWRSLAGEAKRQGYKLNSMGLWHGEDRIAGKSEEQIFEALGLVYVPPTKRNYRAGQLVPIKGDEHAAAAG